MTIQPQSEPQQGSCLPWRLLMEGLWEQTRWQALPLWGRHGMSSTGSSGSTSQLQATQKYIHETHGLCDS